MDELSLLLAVAPDAARESGRYIGMGLAVLLIGWGFVASALAFRQEGMNKLCAASLLCFFAGWFASAVATILGGQQNMIVSVLVALFFFLCVFTGLILGVVGLATYDKHRHRRGRPRAIWAICLGVAGLLLLGVGFAIGFKRGMDSRADSKFTQKEKNSHDGPGEPIKNEKLNFSLQPSARWIPLDTKINALACVTMRRSSPEGFFIVIAENIGQELELDALKSVAKASLKSATEIQSQEEETVEINGNKFAHIQTTAKLASPPLSLDYEHWLITANGFSWQLVFWGKNAEDRSILAKEAKAVVETFKILDPDFKPSLSGSVEDVDLPNKGYRTQLAGSGWHRWVVDEPLTDFAALRGEAAIQVIPLYFKDKAPELEACTLAYMSMFGFSDTTGLQSKPWKPGIDAEGIEYVGDRVVDREKFHYILRIARDEHSAYLVAGWAQANSPEDRKLVEEGLEKIELIPRTGPLPEDPPNSGQSLATLYNEVGMSMLKKDDSEAAHHWFQEAYTKHEDPVVLANLAETFERLEKPGEGIQKLEPEFTKFPDNFGVNNAQARLYVLDGKIEQGNAIFVKQIEKKQAKEAMLLDWMTLLVEQKAHAQAIATADAWIEKKPSTRAKRWRAQTIFISGDQNGGLEALKKLHEEDPKDIPTQIDLGSYANDAGESELAEKVARALIEGGNDSSDAQMILGWSQFDQRKFEDAKATFERAAVLQPNDDEIISAIRTASAKLGQGNNSNISKPIESVKIPSALAAEIKEHTAPKGFGYDANAVYLTRVTGYQFEKDKPRRRTTRNTVKILTDEGADSFSTIEAPFDPLSERVFVNRAEVKDAEGKVIGQGQLKDAYVRDLDDGMATHDQVMTVQIPGVKPGCTLEWEISYENLWADNKFEFERKLFVSVFPVQVEALFVAGDIDTLKTVDLRAESLKKIKKPNLLAWMDFDKNEVTFEPFAVPTSRLQPIVILGSDEGGWKKIGDTFLESIQDRLKVDPTVEKLAKDLTKELKEPKEKISALSRYVQKKFSYKAIEFGVRARRPNLPTVTIENGYGDCKDLALLLHQLLEAAGIPSDLTLIHTSFPAESALPSLDQFNHMVLHVPDLGENWLLDPTDRNLDLGRFPADGFWQNRALVLKAGASRLINTPKFAAAGTCPVTSSRVVTPSEANWKVEETLTLDGYTASWMRNAFNGLNPDQRSRKAQAILAEHGAIQLNRIEIEEMDNPALPVKLKMSYTVRDAIRDGQTGAVPAAWEQDYLATTFVPNRRTPFEFQYPIAFSSNTNIRIGGQADPSALATLTQKGTSDYCNWNISATAPSSGDAVKIAFEFEGKTGEWPANGYQDAHDAWDRARRLWDRPISWSPAK